MPKPIANYKFTQTESSAIKELIKYSANKKIESARIIKADKDITDKFILIEDDLRCNLLPKGEKFACENADCKLFKTLKKKVLLKDSTYIHYHPYDLPLSIGDVLTSFNANLQKMIAVTKDGKYSIFIPNNNSTNKPIKELYTANTTLVNAMKRNNGSDYILKNSYVFSKYKNQLNAFWQQIAKQTGSTYISNL